MPKYTVVFTNTYEVEADNEESALETAEMNGRLVDADAFIEESYFA